MICYKNYSLILFLCIVISLIILCLTFIPIFFLLAIYSDEFMRAMNVGENTPSILKDSTDVRDALRSPNKKKRDANMTKTSFYTFKSNDNILQKIQNPSLVSDSKNNTSSSEFSELKKIESNGSTDGNNNNNNSNNSNSNGSDAKQDVARSDTTSKLEVFIICRLGK